MRVAPDGGWIMGRRWAGHARHPKHPGRPSHPGRRVRVLGAAAAATGLLMVAGCTGGSSSAGGGSGSGTSNVTVAATRGVADVPLYIAFRNGLFRQAGLNVTIHTYSSVKDEVAALRSGKANFAFGDYADMFYAQEQRHSPDLAIVADGYDAGPNTMEVLTLPRSGIVQPQQLRGKIIGTSEPQVMPASGSHTSSQPFSLETVATQSVLSNDNVPPSQIGWQPMPSGQLIKALGNGQVNAILATEPTIYQAESQLGAIPVLDSCTGATANLPLDGYFTTRPFAQHNPGTVNAFHAALEKAQTIAGQAAPVRSVLTSVDGLSPQSASLVTLGIYPTSLSASNLQRVVSLMFFYNAIPHPLTVKNLILR